MKSFHFYIIVALILAVCGLQTVSGQIRFSVIDLGALGTVSAANGINDSGVVVGYYAQSGVRHSFRYDHGVITDLGSLSDSSLQVADLDPSKTRAEFGIEGNAAGGAYGINNLGEIVGNSPLSGNQGAHAFLYQNGAMMDIGTLGGNISTATGINDSGYIVGYSEIGNATHAFRYRNGTMTDLGTIGYVFSEAYGINRMGAVVGGSTRADSIQTSFLYENGTMTDIGTLPGGITSEAHAINNFGHVVGSSNLPISGQHAYIYRNGVMTDLGALGAISRGLGINDSDQVVGWTYVSSTIHACLWEAEAIEDLNSLIDPGSGWTLQYAYGINNRGEIVGNGTHNGQSHAFLLMPFQLRITRPSLHELWVAGVADTIRWNSSGVDSVNILLSENYENNAGSFNEIVHGYPAGSGKYVWQIPDTMLSRKCAIEIQSTSNANIDTTGPVFRIKSYELTRVTDDSNYERFVPDKNGWQFLNGNLATLWPSSWTSQFDYYFGNDPFTNSKYPNYFSYIPGDWFPDWPSFVDAFGISACFWNTAIPVYDDDAMRTWGRHCQPYNGSCYGLATSSLLAFDNQTAFGNRFPAVGNLDFLFSNTMTPTIRKGIDEYFNYQFGKVSKDNKLANAWLGPKNTLAQLKAMFLSENNDHRVICFFDPAGSGGHAVTPIRIARDPSTSSWIRIYLYNSNSPGLSSDYIIVDTLTNQWKESTGFGWGWGTQGMYLDILSSELIPLAVVNKNTPLSHPAAVKQINNPLDISTSTTANVHIYSPGGDSIGSYHGTAFSSMANGVPIIPITGFPSPPVGYYLQFGPYSAVIDSSLDTLISFSVSENRTRYQYDRSDAKQNQHDLLSFGDGLALKNPDVSAKSVVFTTVISSDSSDKSYDVAGCVLNQNDSVAVKAFNQEDLKLTNAGSQKSYTLQLHTGSAAGEAKFNHPGIIVQSNSSQQIIPNWTDLSQPVKIYVDLGNDGTIDDSIFVDNQVTGVKDQKGKELPKAFALLQNYPNPFNPMTVISYSLASQVHVKLSVYNILGEEVVRLVNEVQSPGYKSVSFNGNNLPSGIYTYRIVAGNFVQARKMVLMK